jgi:hypothetical protein
VIEIKGGKKMKKRYILITSIAILLIIGFSFYLNQTVNLHIVFNGKKTDNIIQNYAIDKKVTHCYGGKDQIPNEDCLIRVKRIKVWKINNEKEVNNTNIVKGKIDAVSDL